MNKYDVSIVIPAYKMTNWYKIYKQAEESVTKNHTFEIIFCGPDSVDVSILKDQALNVKFITDFGSPSRAFQMASLLAEGKYIAACTEDSNIQPNAFAECIEDMNRKTYDIMVLTYVEGMNIYGPNHWRDFPPAYWTAGYHQAHRPNINSSYLSGMIFLELELFRKYGGLDCKYNNVNMNMHKLFFMMQDDGLKAGLSRNYVYFSDYDPHRTMENSPIIKALVSEDLPYFEQDSVKFTLPSYDNWKNISNRWEKRWK